MGRHYRRKKRDIKSYYKNSQPCWTCKNACGGCCWSREFKPIDGWIAEKNTLISNGQYADTYKIIYCPEYKQDRDY